MNAVRNYLRPETIDLMLARAGLDYNTELPPVAGANWLLLSETERKQLKGNAK
jgi:hypothetical protein